MSAKIHRCTAMMLALILGACGAPQPKTALPGPAEQQRRAPRDLPTGAKGPASPEASAVRLVAAMLSRDIPELGRLFPSPQQLSKDMSPGAAGRLGTRLADTLSHLLQSADFVLRAGELVATCSKERRQLSASRWIGKKPVAFEERLSLVLRRWSGRLVRWDIDDLAHLSHFGWIAMSPPSFTVLPEETTLTQVLSRKRPQCQKVTAELLSAAGPAIDRLAWLACPLVGGERADRQLVCQLLGVFPAQISRWGELAARVVARGRPMVRHLVTLTVLERSAHVVDHVYRELGEVAVPGLIDELAGDDEHRTVTAMSMLGAAGEEAAAAVAALEKALQRDSPAVRMAAAETLGRIGKPARTALTALRRAKGDQDPRVRRAVGAAIRMLEGRPREPTMPTTVPSKVLRSN